MAWQSNEHAKDLDLRGFALSAFQAGYSDGYYDYPKWSGNDRSFYPEYYVQGFDLGHEDRVENYGVVR